jgi:hypothetical protein
MYDAHRGNRAEPVRGCPRELRVELDRGHVRSPCRERGREHAGARTRLEHRVRGGDAGVVDDARGDD